jgi:hypothetical protein
VHDPAGERWLLEQALQDDGRIGGGIGAHRGPQYGPNIRSEWRAV